MQNIYLCLKSYLANSVMLINSKIKLSGIFLNFSFHAFKPCLNILKKCIAFKGREKKLKWYIYLAAFFALNSCSNVIHRTFHWLQLLRIRKSGSECKNWRHQHRDFNIAWYWAFKLPTWPPFPVFWNEHVNSTWISNTYIKY